MKLEEMFADFLRRSRRKFTPEQLITLLQNNHLILDEYSFIIYAVVFDEIRILQPYAARGHSVLPLGRKLEDEARKAGIRWISIETDRPKEFARLTRDYKPVSVVFQKELI